MRQKVSALALNNWFRYLHHIFVSEEGELPLNLALLETDLKNVLHQNPRDDMQIVLAILKVWALAYCLLFRPTERPWDQEMQDSSVAFFIVYKHDPDKIPTQFRDFANLGDRQTTLNDNGIIYLFSHWHHSLVSACLCPIRIEEKLDPFHSLLRFRDTDFQILDHMTICQYIPAPNLYSQPSIINPFTLVKFSGLEYAKMQDIAGSLFDHNPNDYYSSLIGQIVLFARELDLPFLFNDEILAHEKGSALWLLLTENQHYIALVYNGKSVQCTIPSNFMQLKATWENWKLVHPS